MKSICDSRWWTKNLRLTLAACSLRYRCLSMLWPMRILVWSMNSSISALKGTLTAKHFYQDNINTSSRCTSKIHRHTNAFSSITYPNDMQSIADRIGRLTCQRRTSVVGSRSLTRHCRRRSSASAEHQAEASCAFSMSCLAAPWRQMLYEYRVRKYRNTADNTRRL